MRRKSTKNRSGALRRLGITEAQLAGIPRITRILEHAEGGLATVLAALRLSGESEAVAFLSRYDALSVSDRAEVTLEDIAVAAAVPTKRLLEVAVGALVEDSRSTSAIVAATYQARVIRQTAERALSDDVVYDSLGNPHIISGFQDRKLFLTGTGFLPQPARPTQIAPVFNTQVINQYGSSKDGDKQESDADINASPQDYLKMLHEEIDGSRLLEAPRTIESSAQVVLGHQYKEASELSRMEDLDCIPKPRS